MPLSDERLCGELEAAKVPVVDPGRELISMLRLLEAVSPASFADDADEPASETFCGGRQTQTSGRAARPRRMPGPRRCVNLGSRITAW
jgi:hypothetical protein